MRLIVSSAFAVVSILHSACLSASIAHTIRSRDYLTTACSTARCWVSSALALAHVLGEGVERADALLGALAQPGDGTAVRAFPRSPLTVAMAAVPARLPQPRGSPVVLREGGRCRSDLIEAP